MALFERAGLEQDTGLIRPRYAQEGSTVVGTSETVTGTQALYTPPSGKTLFITDISVQYVSSTGSTTTRFYDSYDAEIYLVFDVDSYTGGEILTWHFDTPLTITKYPKTWGYYQIGTATLIITWSGWVEENG